jgi:hypothetical protein
LGKYKLFIVNNIIMDNRINKELKNMKKLMSILTEDNLQSAQPAQPAQPSGNGKTPQDVWG